jgi:hypothetical protein
LSGVVAFSGSTPMIVHGSPFSKMACPRTFGFLSKAVRHKA